MRPPPLSGSSLMPLDNQVDQATGIAEFTFWRGRFLREGMGGLAELARSGRPERIKPSLKGRILSEAVRPPGGVERWSTRSMAKHVGVSKATVQRVWSANDIKPHRTRIFKLSCDEQFEAKFWDVIGVYLDPHRALHPRLPFHVLPKGPPRSGSTTSRSAPGQVRLTQALLDLDNEIVAEFDIDLAEPRVDLLSFKLGSDSSNCLSFVLWERKTFIRWLGHIIAMGRDEGKTSLLAKDGR
jgi:hypothetical protein